MIESSRAANKEMDLAANCFIRGCFEGHKITLNFHFQT